MTRKFSELLSIINLNTNICVIDADTKEKLIDNILLCNLSDKNINLYKDWGIITISIKNNVLEFEITEIPIAEYYKTHFYKFG